MGDQRALDLHGSEAMAGYVDNVVHAPHNPEITVFVFARAVTGKINSFDLRPVLAFVALVVAPDGAEHGGPGLPDHEVSARVGRNTLAGPIHHVGNDAEERSRCRPRLRGSGSRERGNQCAAGFSLPPCIHNGAAPLPDYLLIPDPGFGIDRLSHGSQEAEA